MEDHEDPSAHFRTGRPARQATDLPAGYPEEYQQMATLRDGRSVLIRPIQPSDAPALAAAIRSADADTIRLRYLGGHPQVTPGLLNFLTNVDYTSRFALVAVEPTSRRGVAIARYEPAGQDGTADVAIAVTPGWRDAGLATELLRMLAQAASERGIHTFTGAYLAENRPVTALINTPDAITDQVTSHGIIEFSVALPPPAHEETRWPGSLRPDSLRAELLECRLVIRRDPPSTIQPADRVSLLWRGAEQRLPADSHPVAPRPRQG